MSRDAVTSKLLSTTDSSEWERVGGFELTFETDHPQGLIRVGDRWFLSTVRIPQGEPGNPDLAVAGRGFLIEADRNEGVGTEKARLELCDGMVYHPGGLATDGDALYVPVSEYRPDSSSLIYKVDLETFEVVGDPVEFPDHIGALSIVPGRQRIFGVGDRG